MCAPHFFSLLPFSKNATLFPFRHRDGASSLLPLPFQTSYSALPSHTNSTTTLSSKRAEPQANDPYHFLLHSCSTLKALKNLHSSLYVAGLIQHNTRLGALLIAKYSALGDWGSSSSLFASIQGEGGSFIWNAMIRSYSDGGCYKETIQLYSLMRQTGIRPDSYTYPLVFKACSLSSLIMEGRVVHTHVIRNGFESDLIVSSTLMNMYAKCGEIDNARKLFDIVPMKDLICWNKMITGYEKLGRAEECLDLFRKMQLDGIVAGFVTMVAIAPAVARIGDPNMAGSFHAHVVRCGFESHMFVQSALVEMYSKCAQIDKGRTVFDRMISRDLVCWNSIIKAYEKVERAEESLMLFSQMQQEGLLAGSITVVTVASAIGKLGDVLKARSVHAHVIRNEFLDDVTVGNAVITMYAKCCNVKLARMVFDGLWTRDVISWNSILSGYSQNGHTTEVLELFDQMQVCGFIPDSVTVLIVVCASSYLGSLHFAKKIHDFIISNRIEIKTALRNAIIDMYANCGDLESAVWIFDNSLASERNVSTWNVMISGYGHHGLGREALKLFSRMEEEGNKPNDITYTCVLSACSHSGLVEEGRRYFSDLKQKLHGPPVVTHYACMVDMLGRSGFLDEAWHLIEEMPLEPNCGVWGALLGACRIHGNTELGEIAAKNLLQLMPKHTGYYVLLSNIYAMSSKWHELRQLRQEMHKQGLRKPAAFSVIEFKEKVHGFHTADQSHPLHREVYKKMESLVVEIKMVGYVPDGSCVLHDVEEEDKEVILRAHSEKLAVAFGIMRIDAGMPIQVTKDVRICNDCHSTFKFISHVYKRRIIVRDVNRFHNFEDGFCSCMDYW